MAKAKSAGAASGKAEPAPQRVRTGDTTLADMETAVLRLGECEAELLAHIKWMKAAKADHLTIDGPGLLSRGVNSVLQYLGKVEAAIKAKRRMM